MDEMLGILISANPWRMEDDKTGKLREGISIEYVMNGDMAPKVNDDGSLGYRVIKESIPIECMNQIGSVPGIYNLNYGFIVRGGKPLMKLKSVEYLSEVS